jgi:radical SAM superfamily enzyme YgiQ (UPF0313 family)
VKVLNYNLWDYDLEKEIESQDLVGFTGFEEFLPYIKRDAAVCRAKGIKTILGGALATFKTEEMAQYVDTVIVGEYDRGDVYPDYEGFGIEEYHRIHSERYMGVLTSRGCPYHCTFCVQTCKFSKRDLADVFCEIDSYSERYGISSVIFNDNTLNLSKDRFLGICHGMKDRGLGWGASIRVEPWDEEMTGTAKASGCRGMVVGVESFNQERLDMMHKGVKAKSITDCLDLLNQYEIPYNGNILVGFENDTWEDVTREVESIPGRFKVFPTLVQPFIGTKNGHTRKLDKQQVDFLTNTFKEYVESCGKYLYPALPEGGLQ